MSTNARSKFTIDNKILFKILVSFALFMLGTENRFIGIELSGYSLDQQVF